MIRLAQGRINAISLYRMSIPGLVVTAIGLILCLIYLGRVRARWHVRGIGPADVARSWAKDEVRSDPDGSQWVKKEIADGVIASAIENRDWGRALFVVCFVWYQAIVVALTFGVEDREMVTMNLAWCPMWCASWFLLMAFEQDRPSPSMF